MADILIRGMEMPISGATFRVVEDLEGNKFLTSADYMNGLYYPLVEIPPHGDLIDRDKLFPVYADLLDGGDVKAVIPRICIDLAHVIIPKSEVENNG